MSCPVCPRQIGVPNTGSGLGLGSNEVAVVQNQPSSYSYNWWLNTQGKVGVVAGSCAVAQSMPDGSQPPRKTNSRSAPIYVFRTNRCNCQK